MIGYKLTTQDMTTYRGFRWVIGKPEQTLGDGELCGPGWLHYYESPLLALLHNPIHAVITNPRLWECEIAGEVKRDNGMKSGCTKLTLLREMTVPTIETDQRVEYAIRCAKTVCKGSSWRTWNAWADKWLDCTDRSDKAAWAAWVAGAAARAAWAAEAAEAAAEAAAGVAARAAGAAAGAAAEAAKSGSYIDLIALAEQSCH